MRKLALAAAAAAVVGVFAGSAWATHQPGHLPADKVAVTASSIEFIDCTKSGSGSLDPAFPTGCGDQDPITILTTQLKLSTPTDLIFSFTAECALWTETKTKGNQSSSAEATVNVWVEIADEVGSPPFVVSSGVGGSIVLCNRMQKLTTTDFTGTEGIDLFISTRSANGFNWVALNPVSTVSDNVITVTVKATLVPVTGGDGDVQGAAAAIGKRTLIVTPTKLVKGTTLPGPPVPQCADGVDNDGDGYIDLLDSQCSDLLDDTEAL